MAKPLTEADRKQVVQALRDARPYVEEYSGANPHADLSAVDAALALMEAVQVQEWLPIESAPRDAAFLGCVEGRVRRVHWGKTSHVPIYGFCLADQGAEEFDLCDPTCWMPLPAPPAEVDQGKKP